MNKAKKILFIFAHGAGAGKDSEFMLQASEGLQQLGVQVQRFNFPYMALIQETGKRRPPDRMPKLIAAFQQQVENQINDKNFADYSLFVGGKSMGGRVASLLAAQPELDLPIKGVICFGFPFHPPKKVESYRGEHLQTMRTPTLILQGERDTFGSIEEVKNYQLSSLVDCHFLPDGDHSLKPRKKSGFSFQENLTEALKKTNQFFLEHL